MKRLHAVVMFLTLFGFAAIETQASPIDNHLRSSGTADSLVIPFDPERDLDWCRTPPKRPRPTGPTIPEPEPIINGILPPPQLNPFPVDPLQHPDYLIPPKDWPLPRVGFTIRLPDPIV